jgi:hypothetical protein
VLEKEYQGHWESKEFIVASTIKEIAHNGTPLRKPDLIHAFVTINAQFNTQRAVVKSMLDSGSHLNIITPMLAKQYKLQVEPLPTALAKFINGSSATVYGITNINITVQDSRGKHHTTMAPFVVMESVYDSIILGMPWLEAVNPRVNYREKRFVFIPQVKEQYNKIGTVNAEQFASLLQDDKNQLFVCSIGAENIEGIENMPSCYNEYLDVASEESSTYLPPHGPQDLPIDIEEGKIPPFGPLYNLSESELVILRQYLDKFLARGWIKHSRSPAGAPILFVKKKDGTLRLCVDYRGLNNITIKNRGPLPLIQESLDRLSRASIFTSLDLREAYHRLRIKEGDEWKTAFRTRYGHFEYQVVPFGLTNAPAAFQAYINQALTGLLDVICIVYLDDILIFSNSEQEHIQHVKTVLQRLREYKLYIKLSKSKFHTTRTEYLGYIVTPEGISIDQDRVTTILEWPEPKTVHDIRVFIGFLNYYRRFVRNFARIAAPLNILTHKEPGQAKKGTRLKQEESQVIDIGKKGRKAFQELRNLFLQVPILAHYNPSLPTRVETDGSGAAISGILSQQHTEEDNKAHWRPVAFFSRKLIDRESRWKTEDIELLAILESLETWRRYLMSLSTPFTVKTDHRNLLSFMKTKNLNSRQVRWAERLSEYHFVIQHSPGKINPADGPSRRPDYTEGAHIEAKHAADTMLKQLQLQLSLTQGEISRDEVISALTLNSETTGTPRRSTRLQVLQERQGVQEDAPSSPLSPQTTQSDQLSRSEDYEDSLNHSDSQDATASDNEGPPELELVVNEQDKARILKECHSDPLAGHWGQRRTIEKVRRRYNWPYLRRDVSEFITSCLVCRHAKPVRHAPYGLLRSLNVPDTPWADITLDFIMELPPSEYDGKVYDTILVVVDKLTKMAHYIPTVSTLSSTGLTFILLREVIRLHGVPSSITSDRGKQMDSKYYKTFIDLLGSIVRLSTAFHPQTDGQTERQNQSLEQYLRAYCAYEQDDWATWINLAEFAYNDSRHDALGITPFQAYTGRHPRSAETPPGRKIAVSPQAEEVASYIIEQQRRLKLQLEHTNATYAKWYNKKKKDYTLQQGDQVMLNAKNIKTTRPKKKLDRKFLGPYLIKRKINDAVYQLDLPNHIKIHPVFHISLLEKYTPSSRFTQPQPPMWDIVPAADNNIWDVEAILDKQRDKDGKWLYLIKWRGYNDSENTWEHATDISASALRTFHNKLRQETAKEGRGRPQKRRKIV